MRPACMRQLFFHMRVSHSIVSVEDFIFCVWRTVEDSHCAAPEKRLMDYNGDVTARGFIQVMRLMLQIFGESFVLEAVWNLGYNAVFQYSIMRGTMRNVHDESSEHPSCDCFAHDALRERFRRADDEQFRREVHQEMDRIQTAESQSVESPRRLLPSKSMRNFFSRLSGRRDEQEKARDTRRLISPYAGAPARL